MCILRGCKREVVNLKRNILQLVRLLMPYGIFMHDQLFFFPLFHSAASTGESDVESRLPPTPTLIH